MTRQDKTKQDKTRQGKARQDKARQDKKVQGKARQTGEEANTKKFKTIQYVTENKQQAHGKNKNKDKTTTDK